MNLPVSELDVAADRVVVGLGLAEVGDDEREANVVERRAGDHLAADEVGVPGRRRRGRRRGGRPRGGGRHFGRKEVPPWNSENIRNLKKKKALDIKNIKTLVAGS